MNPEVSAGVHSTLLKALQDKSARVRCAAAEELRDVRIPGLRAILLLHEQQEKDDAVRAELIVTLGGIGGPEVTPLLRARLRDGAPTVRAAACRCLGSHAEVASLEMLRSLLHDDAESVRQAAKEATRRLGTHVLLQLDEWLRSDELQRACDGIELLGLSGGSAQLATLEEYLFAEQPAVRYAAIEALGEIGHAEQNRQTHIWESVRGLLIQGLAIDYGKPESHLRHVALKWLGRSHDPKCAGPILWACRREEFDDYSIGISALRELGGSAAIAALRALRNQYREDLRPRAVEIRIATLEALHQLEEANLVDDALAACQSPFDSERAVGVRILARQETGTSLKTLITLLEHADSRVVETVFASLMAWLPSPADLDTLRHFGTETEESEHATIQAKWLLAQWLALDGEHTDLWELVELVESYPAIDGAEVGELIERHIARFSIADVDRLCTRLRDAMNEPPRHMNGGNRPESPAEKALTSLVSCLGRAPSQHRLLMVVRALAAPSLGVRECAAQVLERWPPSEDLLNALRALRADPLQQHNPPVASLLQRCLIHHLTAHAPFGVLNELLAIYAQSSLRIGPRLAHFVARHKAQVDMITLASLFDCVERIQPLHKSDVAAAISSEHLVHNRRSPEISRFVMAMLTSNVERLATSALSAMPALHPSRELLEAYCSFVIRVGSAAPITQPADPNMNAIMRTHGREIEVGLLTRLIKYVQQEGASAGPAKQLLIALASAFEDQPFCDSPLRRHLAFAGALFDCELREVRDRLLEALLRHRPSEEALAALRAIKRSHVNRLANATHSTEDDNIQHRINDRLAAQITGVGTQSDLPELLNYIREDSDAKRLEAFVSRVEGSFTAEALLLLADYSLVASQEQVLAVERIVARILITSSLHIPTAKLRSFAERASSAKFPMATDCRLIIRLAQTRDDTGEITETARQWLVKSLAMEDNRFNLHALLDYADLTRLDQFRHLLAFLIRHAREFDKRFVERPARMFHNEAIDQIVSRAMQQGTMDPNPYLLLLIALAEAFVARRTGIKMVRAVLMSGLSSEQVSPDTLARAKWPVLRALIQRIRQSPPPQKTASRAITA